MDFTKSRGNVTELQCISKFMEMGFDCSIPYGDNCKYDFIVDLGDELIRVQCKSCINPINKHNESGRDFEAIQFSCVAQTTNTQKTIRHTYTSNDIDYFATYYNGNVYVVPVEECSTSKTLRFSPPKGGQLNYNKAEDYLIEKVFNHKKKSSFIEQELAFKENYFNKDKISYICSQCGINETTTKGGICIECSHKNSRKSERPTREEMKKLIREKSFLQLGKEYNVSDNAIRKWCLSMNLPTKKSEIKQYSDEEWSNI